MKLRRWLLVIRLPFLILPIVLVFFGTSIAWYDGYFNFGYALLAFLGFLLAHISVNVLNEYHDFKSGLDLATKRTPFSGGSGALPAGLFQPGQVLWLGLISFLAAVPIGIYFVIVSGWQLLPLILVAAACLLLYTPFILKTGYPEWAPGIGFGLLPILGFYFVQTGSYTLPVFIAAIPSTILAHNLLLLNEFPDVEADRNAGRKTLPIFIGKEKASIVYSSLTILVYLWIVGGVAATWITGSVVMPPYCLIALLTLPFAIKVIIGSRQYQDIGKIVPAMANNVLIVILTPVLLGVGYILSRVFLV